MDKLTLFNNKCISIYENINTEPVVLGRDLHVALGVKTPYEQWFSWMAEYRNDKGFRERKDYWAFRDRFTTALSQQNHLVSLPMAERIASVVQRNDIIFQMKEKTAEIQALRADERNRARILVDELVELTHQWLENKKKGE